MERRLLERLDASKIEDMESVRQSETFLAPEISIGVPLATWTNLTGENIKESRNEELLVIWSMAPESISKR